MKHYQEMESSDETNKGKPISYIYGVDGMPYKNNRVSFVPREDGRRGGSLYRVRIDGNSQKPVSPIREQEAYYSNDEVRMVNSSSETEIPGPSGRDHLEFQPLTGEFQMPEEAYTTRHNNKDLTLSFKLKEAQRYSCQERPRWNACVKTNPPSKNLEVSYLTLSNTRVEHMYRPAMRRNFPGVFQRPSLIKQLFVNKGYTYYRLPNYPMPESNSFADGNDMKDPGADPRHRFIVDMTGFEDSETYLTTENKTLKIEGVKDFVVFGHRRRVIESITLPKGVQADNLLIARDDQGFLHIQEAWKF